MFQWEELVIVYSFFALLGASSGEMGLERIENCATHCSQGLHCKSKPDYFISLPCHNPTEGLNTTSVFHNVSLSTVMRCTGRKKCSLHLRVTTHLQLTDSIQGLSICTATAGMIMRCRSVRFTKKSRQNMSQQLVKVTNDCSEVVPNQQVYVTVKTMPSYCGVTFTDTYYTPGCRSDDLSRHVPECITGQLSYSENPEKKELSISVSGMLDDHDYNLRLCYKSFICFGTGSNTLIKKEQPVKSAVLSYSQPFPCLCIEGWSAVMDAPRVQVCPFKDRLEELWTGVTFNPFEDALIWEPACPVSAVVSLCQKKEDSVCVNLPESSHDASKNKITFSRVDPHPHLCMKFTTSSGSWTKCPFADSFQGWKVDVFSQQGNKEVTIWSQVTGVFLLELCEKSAASPDCHSNKTHSMHVEKHKVSKSIIPSDNCNFCLQVKRLDVNYGVTINQCFNNCNTRGVVSNQNKQKLNWIAVAVGVCLAALIITTFTLLVLLKVFKGGIQKRSQSVKSKLVLL
ncbi:putative interleukin-17 receptor E-like isoform X2 [Gouania willdenowi]|uniref:putative interleukin-17 receptor E-like isoform X2 n=1 Tax=Gouania willdenowi TaxID=441366 RepID=UPI001056C5B1|nr:putative interleukin-17 receptor E-like isoform X2 [Gouania willdenowi]